MVEKASSGDWPFSYGVREENELVRPYFSMSAYIDEFPSDDSTSMNSYPLSRPLMWASSKTVKPSFSQKFYQF